MVDLLVLILAEYIQKQEVAPGDIHYN